MSISSHYKAINISLPTISLQLAEDPPEKIPDTMLWYS
jgi:hypothetical protein